VCPQRFSRGFDRLSSGARAKRKIRRRSLPVAFCLAKRGDARRAGSWSSIERLNELLDSRNELGRFDRLRYMLLVARRERALGVLGPSVSSQRDRRDGPRRKPRS
jgi:hypothetical protein